MSRLDEIRERSKNVYPGNIRSAQEANDETRYLISLIEGLAGALRDVGRYFDASPWRYNKKIKGTVKDALKEIIE